jgi:hypothetical protein
MTKELKLFIQKFLIGGMILFIFMCMGIEYKRYRIIEVINRVEAIKGISNK